MWFSERLSERRWASLGPVTTMTGASGNSRREVQAWSTDDSTPAGRPLDQVRKVAACEGCVQRCIVMSGAGQSMHGTRARAGGLRGACGHGLRSRDSLRVLRGRCSTQSGRAYRSGSGEWERGECAGLHGASVQPRRTVRHASSSAVLSFTGWWPRALATDGSERYSRKDWRVLAVAQVA